MAADGEPLLESVSERMFGRAMRVPIFAKVRNAEPGFFAAEIADALGYPASNVAKELERLVQLAMIRALPQVRGDRAKRFEVIESPLWQVIDSVLAAWGELGNTLDQLLVDPGP